MAYLETILLVEPDQSAVRTVSVTQRGVNQVIERLHLDPLDPKKLTVRVWVNKNQETDLTRQVRIFRENLPPAPPEPVEKPLYDELVLKTPLKLTEHDA